jgi:hypothetical protein
MTLFDRQVALGAVVRSASALPLNLTAVLALCSMNGSVPEERGIQIRFVDSHAPTVSTVNSSANADEQLSSEFHALVGWLAASQLSLDREERSALYEDRWANYL